MTYHMWNFSLVRHLFRRAFSTLTGETVAGAVLAGVAVKGQGITATPARVAGTAAENSILDMLVAGSCRCNFCKKASSKQGLRL